MKSEFHAFTYSIEIVLHYTPVLGEKGGVGEIYPR